MLAERVVIERPNRRTGKMVPCSNCQRPVYRQRHQLDREQAFCQRLCESQFKTGRMTGADHPRFKTAANTVAFTDEQKELVVGSLLGDASLCINGANAHFSVSHSEKQSAYLKYKQTILEPHSRQGVPYNRFDSRHGVTYTTVRFHTRCHPYLTGLRAVFYPEGEKVIPESIGRLLTARSLAFWYMDDGSKNTQGLGGLIATCAFSRPDVEMICGELQKLFSLICYPTKDNRIYLAAATWSAFREIIKPYLIPEMEYKIG